MTRYLGILFAAASIVAVGSPAQAWPSDQVEAIRQPVVCRGPVSVWAIDLVNHSERRMAFEVTTLTVSDSQRLDRVRVVKVKGGDVRTIRLRSSDARYTAWVIWGDDEMLEAAIFGTDPC